MAQTKTEALVERITLALFPSICGAAQPPGRKAFIWNWVDDTRTGRGREGTALDPQLGWPDG